MHAPTICLGQIVFLMQVSVYTRIPVHRYLIVTPQIGKSTDRCPVLCHLDPFAHLFFAQSHKIVPAILHSPIPSSLPFLFFVPPAFSPWALPHGPLSPSSFLLPPLTHAAGHPSTSRRARPSRRLPSFCLCRSSLMASCTSPSPAGRPRQNHCPNQTPTTIAS